MRISRKRTEYGVTLVELMIAIALVAILSGGLLTSMRTSLGVTQKIEQRLSADRRVMNVQQIIARQIAAAMPVTGLCPSNDKDPSSDKEKTTAIVPFFLGTETSSRFVSSYSIAEGARGVPQIVEYQAQISSNGRVRLAVAEHIYTGPASTAAFCRDLQALPVQMGPAALVLVDGLASCRFTYHLPYDNYVYKEKPWIAAWSIPLPALPAAIRIQMQPAERSATALPLFEITAPIRADRNVMAQYSDAD